MVHLEAKNVPVSRGMIGIEYLLNTEKWGKGSPLSISNMVAVMDELDLPGPATRIVHIGGTNGKGSVSASIAAGLGASGLSVGLTSSPHLIHFSERFIIDGKPASLPSINSAALKLKAVLKRKKLTLTYHEAMIAVAFIIFRDVDWIVAEVGMGGRFDSTNFLKNPALSVITNIGLDHQRFLGNSISEISKEKAGIIKPGVPLVTGPMQSEAREAIRESREEYQGEWWEYGSHFEGVPAEPGRFVYRDLREEFERKYEIRLLGKHQVTNMAIVVTALRALGVAESSIETGLRTVQWPGRLKPIIVSRNKDMRASARTLWLDGAHNLPAVQTISSFIEQNFTSKPDIVFAASRGKEWQPMLEHLLPYIGNWNIVSPGELFVPGEELVSFLQERTAPCIFHPSLAGLLDKLSVLPYDDRATPDNGFLFTDNVICTGSLYLVGEVYKGLNIAYPTLWERGT